MREFFYLAVVAFLFRKSSSFNLDGSTEWESESSVECTPPLIAVDGQCKECSAGTYIGASDCIDCPVGSYTDTVSQSSCTQCPSGTSTVSIGSTSSSDCISVCTVTAASYSSSMSVLAGTNVATGTTITTTCQSGYFINGQSTFTEACSSSPTSCRSVTTTIGQNGYYTAGSNVQLTCTVVSGDSPTLGAADICTWSKGGVPLASVSQFSATGTDNTFQCIHTLSGVSAGDAASYSCSAVIGSHTETSSTSATLSVLTLTFDQTQVVERLGASTQFTCTATVPTTLSALLTFEWEKDGTKITSGVISDDYGTTRKSVLTLSPLTSSNTGKYKCTGTYSNVGTVTSSEKQLVVLYIITALKDAQIITGAAHTFTCDTYGTDQTIEWTKPDSSKVPGTQTSTSTTDGIKRVTNELQLSSSAATDGSYTCTVTNTGVSGSVTGSASLNGYTSGWRSTQADVYAAVGGSATLTLVLDTSSPSGNIYTSILWHKDGNAIYSGVVNTADTPTAGKTQTVLTVSGVTISDDGYYSCVVTYSDIGAVTSAATKFFVKGLVTAPANTAGDRGSTVTLTAVFSGASSTTVAWKKASLTSGASFSATDVGTAAQTYDEATLRGTYTLTITNLQDSNEAAFLAEASFVDTSKITSPAAALSVFHAEVTQGYGFVGSSVTLTAKITANEQASNVVWFKNGARMTESSTETYDVSTGVTTSTITIATLAAGDFTTYKVSADFESFTVTVNSPDMTLNQLTVNTNPSGKNIKIGDSSTLTCKIDYPTGFTAVATVAWVRTTDNFNFDGTVTNTATSPGITSLMKIFPASAANAGIWECTVQFVGISGTLKSSSATVTVSGITTSPAAQAAVLGAAVTFSCVASTLAEPTVAWSKDNVAISAGSGTSITNTYSSTTFTSVLVLVSAATADESYKCVVTDSTLSTSYESAATLTPLKVVTQPAAVAITSASSTDFITCVVTAYTGVTSSVTWYRGSSAIDSKLSTETTSGSLTTSIVSFSSTSKADSGEYYCKATYTKSGNFAGGVITSNTATVDVIGVVPSDARRNWDWHAVTGRARSLSCVAFGSAQADSVTWTFSSGALSTIGSPTSTETYSATIKETTSTLSWSAVPSSATGTFTCTFQYGDKTVSDTRSFVVQSKGLSSPMTSLVGNGATVTFSAYYDTQFYTSYQIYGYDDSTPNWRTLSTGGAYSLTNDVGTGLFKLEVNTLQSHDIAYYLSVNYQDTGGVWNHKSDIAYLYSRKFTTSPVFSPVVSAVGTAASLSCVYDGDRTDTIKWYKGSDEVQQVAGKISYYTTPWDDKGSQTSYLNFDSPTNSDSGDYKCRAVITADSSTVDSSTAYIGFPRIDPPSAVYGVVGVTLSLQCNIYIGTAGQAKLDPSPVISFSDGSSPITLTSSGADATKMTYGGDVPLADSSKFSPTKTYKCSASFSTSTLSVDSADFDISPLVITTAPTSVSTTAGTAATFTCSASSPSAHSPTIDFYSAGVKLSSSGDLTVSSITTTNFIATKTLVHGNPQSDQSITCQAAFSSLVVQSGSTTVSSTAVNLNVLKNSGSATTSLTGYDGVTLTITCQFTHSPTSVSWTKDGTLVDTTTNSGYEKSSSAPNHYLRIVSPKTTDAGAYTCVADYGTATVSGTVTTVAILGFSLVPTYTKVKEITAFTMSCTLSAGLSSGNLEMIKSHPSFISGWTDVVHSQFVNWDAESQELQIKTNSALNSNERITVEFYSSSTLLSTLMIRFANAVQFGLDSCTYSTSILENQWSNFDSTPTTETNKAWRVTEKADQSTLYIYCNDELVLTYVYASSSIQPGCANLGAGDVTRMKFHKSSSAIDDTASDTYRIVDAPKVVLSQAVTGNQQAVQYTKATSDITDTGSYYCSANSGQAISQAADLVVVGVTTDPTDTEGYLGGTAKFTCSAQSDTEASGFEWYNSNGLITIDNSKYQESREFDVCSCETFVSTSVLTLNSLTAADASTYYCKPLYGSITTTSDSGVLVIRYDELPVVYAVKDAESTITLKWTNTNIDQSTITFALKFKTTSGGSLAAVSGTKNNHEYTYKITSTTVAYGDYFWVGEVTIGGQKFTTPEMQIVVVEETVTPAHIQKYTSGSGEALFTCQFTATRAFSATSISWYKNGNQLLVNEEDTSSGALQTLIYALDYTSGTGASKSVLQIKNPTADAEGYYHCAATYTDGSSSKTFPSSPAGLYTVTISPDVPIHYNVDAYTFSCTVSIESSTTVLSFYDINHSAKLEGASVNLDTTTSDNQRTATFTYAISDWAGTWSGESAIKTRCIVDGLNHDHSLTLYRPTASITPPTANVFATEEHVISCVLGDIPEQISGVTWSPATETATKYALVDGSIGSNSQTSKLTITASQLVTLDGESSGIHTFTCSFSVGSKATAITATQTITIFNPTASITPPTANVFATEEHVISCVLGDIPEQISGVTWSPATETATKYALVDGSISSNSQTSKLTISASQLVTLDGESSGIHTFTCSFSVGSKTTAITATQTITIFNPTASITPPTANVFATEEHVISCVLGDIPEQISGVTWSPATETATKYALVDGSIGSNSQTSKLTITASQLVTLDGESSGIHTFTCSFSVGSKATAITATQTITIFNPTATITPDTQTVLAVENHVISCVLGDIPEQISGVTWSPATETANQYALVDGTISSNSQTSTLTIYAAKLATLYGESSGVHTFTCRFTVGSTNQPVAATQTVTILNPSAKVTGPVTVSKNGGAILTCTLSGITASTAVTWLTSARAIGDSNSNYNKNSNAFNLADGSQVHTLSISSAVLSPPSMIYTCRFEPAAGVQLTDTYTLNIINPVITENPTATSVTSGSSFTLTCKGTGVEPADMTVTSFWTKDDQNVNAALVSNTAVSTSEVVSTLAIAYMQSSLSGQYKCGINYGGDIIYSTATSINVAGILYFPTHALVVTGQALTISIQTITDTAHTSIAWYKDNTIMVPSEADYTITTTDKDESSNKITTSTLVWTNVAASNQDSVLHVELATDSYYLISNKAVVNVLEVYTQPQDYKILRSIDTYIYCSFEGPPQPSIQWLSHSNLAASGVDVTDRATQITALTPSSQLTVYQSRLTVNVDASAGPTYWSCKATYPSYTGKYVFTGGQLTTNVACLTPIGVTAVTGPSTLTVGATATFTAKADNPPEPAFTWKFNGYSIGSISSSGSQISTTEYEYVYTKSSMQVTDSGTYGALAVYADYGSSALVTVNTNVVNACARLAAPANGQLVCDPTTFSTTSTTIPTQAVSETSVACTVVCGSGYKLQSTQSVYQCTDGTWEQQSVVNPFNKVSKCLRVVAPTSYTLTISVGYRLPWVASCTDYYGDYLRIAFPYHVANAASSLSCVKDGDCSLVDSYFAYDNANDACYSTGNTIWLKAQYKQTGNTATDKRSGLFGEFSSWVRTTSFLPFTLLSDASCIGDCSCCIKDSCMKAPTTIMARLKCSSNNRRKRSVGDDFPEFSYDDFGGFGNVSQLERSEQFLCGPGSVPLGDSCIVCVEGTYQSGNECLSCPIGTYQENSGSTTCSSCPAETSTTSTGATNPGLCIAVCQMEDVRYGVSEPPSGWIVKLGDPVSVRCTEGFQFAGKSISVTKLESCNVMPACSRVHITTPSLNVLEGSSFDLNCKVTSVSPPELCVFYKDSQQYNATEPISLGGGMFECTTKVLQVQNSDEASYSCSAVWEEEEDAEPSNEINVRVMGMTFDITSNVYAEGSDHTFFCAATVPSDSAVIISWTRNGQPVGERLTATSNPAIGVLNLVDISPRHQGAYQCSATYLGIGTVVSEASSLTVLGFLESLNDMDVTKGSKTTLHCKPTLGEVSWSFNDSPLSLSSNSLEINSAELQDQGTYSCQASFQGETISSSATITVSDSGITRHPTDTSVESGGIVTVTCATNIDSSFKWFNNDEEVTSGIENTARQSVLVTSPLTVRSHLQCVVSAGEKTFFSKIGVVNVVGFETVPQDKGLSVGGEVSLLCSATGDGLEKLVWMRDNSVEVESRNMEVHRTGYLTSNVLTTSEEGTYFCRAHFETYTIESERASVSLVRVEMSDEAASLGDDVTLTCTVSGVMKADLIVWTRNGELIFNDKSPTPSLGEDKSTSLLTLKSITMSDSGEYRCAASILSDLSVHSSEPAPLRLLGFIDTVTDVVVKRGQVTEVVFSVQHKTGLQVSCDLSEGSVAMGSGVVHGDVVQYRGEVISVGESVKEIQYSCSVDYGSHVVIKSEVAKIFIVDEPTLEVDSSYVLIGEEAVLTITADYISNVPAVHWRVNNMATVQYSASYTASQYRSTLQWPVTQDIEVEATVHDTDVGGYSMKRAVVLAYGVERITGPEQVHLGESYNLTCTVATIDEETEVTWYREDTQLLPHSTMYFDNEISSVLYLPEVTTSDIGVYVCKAMFSDKKESSGAFYVTQTNDCKLPNVENALMDTSSDVVAHSGELSVKCGEETIVMKCEHGSWDQALVFCPVASSSLLNVQLITGIVVLLVLIAVCVSAAYFYKKTHVVRAVTPLSRPDSVLEMKRQWRDCLDDTHVIPNPSAEVNDTVVEDVNLATQYHQQLERSVTQISS
ncbi:hypothetical protein ACHWQZ_G015335 [Mnemiopsis leidyi]